MIRTQRVLYLAGILFLLGFVSTVSAHGDVTPQALNTKGLENLGDEWLEENPYEGNSVAIEIGASGYNQNCARCHGLQVISGGIAPDLRYLPLGLEGDEWYMMRVRNGYSQNGAYKMPPFENILSQEAMWAIRSFIVSKHEEE
jgi:cytochrome c-550 PedF